MRNPPAILDRRAPTPWWSLGRTGLLRGLLGMAVERSLACRLGEHRVEHFLDRQGVAAATGGFEEVAVAVPCIGVEGDGVGAVVAGEAGPHGLQLHPVWLVRVAHCLLDLAD